MKTKRIIYFLLIIIGAVIMASDTLFEQKEYALSVGIVLLMFGIYKSTQVWTNTSLDKEDDKRNSNTN